MTAARGRGGGEVGLGVGDVAGQEGGQTVGGGTWGMGRWPVGEGAGEEGGIL